jgi:hypothetical protein
MYIHTADEHPYWIVCVDYLEDIVQSTIDILEEMQIDTIQSQHPVNHILVPEEYQQHLPATPID